MKTLTPQIAALYIGRPLAIDGKPRTDFILDHKCFIYDNFKKIESGEWKPILRRLSDITEEEALEIWNMDEECLVRYHSEKVMIGFDLYTDSFLYLLSKGFDLFNLIDSGLAVDNNQHPTK